MTSELRQTDRRSHRRYPLQTPLRYRAANAPLNAAWKQGTALNMSADGILVQLGETVAVGAKLELAMEWPGLYHGRDKMRLFLTAAVTRCEAGRTAFRIVKHRFREVTAPRVRLPRTDKNRAVA
jgi:hypothetical protein